MTRNEIRSHILDMADSKNVKLTIKLVPGITHQCYGVKIPLLRKLAKEIQVEQISYPMADDCYEEVILRGITIASMKCDFDTKLEYIKEFVPQITNWAVCDVFCSSLKINEKDRAKFRTFLDDYIHSKEEFHQRFAIISLMSLYLDKTSIDDTLSILEQSASDRYYVQMAVAWALSVCFVKHRDKTLEVLRCNRLDRFTHNKALQKIRESLRVSKEDKELTTNLKLK